MLARIATLAVVLAIAATATACGAAPRAGASPPIGRADLAAAQLIARVKTALLNDSIVGVRRIDVHASGDQIRLTGRVASTAERDRAVQIAQGVDGVRRVTSELEIRP